jgi:hypothetical protein
MIDVKSEKTLGNLLGFGLAAIATFLVIDAVTDPVNAPKLFLLGAIGTSVFFITLRYNLKKLFAANRASVILLFTFNLSALIAVLFSSGPIHQNLYGLYGRNSGFLTYLFLSFLFLGTLTLRDNLSFRKILIGLAVAGTVNVAYSLWVIAFGDFVGWANPFGNILGTFGNPNFIGAFLGIFFSVLLALLFAKECSNKSRILIFAVASLTLFEIYDSSAIQGRIVSAIGLGVVGFYFIRSRYSFFITASYSALGLIASSLAALGALQIGPLTDLIYKYSVSLRGQYWLAGWNTGIANPVNGVGMDGFGDYYRMMRDEHALKVPGINTVVNASHNVYLDFFAFGGWPLFLSYIALVALGLWSIIRVTRAQKVYDPIFTGMVVIWVGYQAQSLISINQIGLAIWGWVLTAALIAYSRNLRSKQTDGSSGEISNPKTRRVVKTSQESVVSPQLVAGIGLVVGGLLASPPLAADVKWRSAQKNMSVESLESVLKPSFMNPQNSTKYLVSIQSLEQSNLPDLARKYAQEAVRFNPNSFELWKVFFLIQASTPEEKALALENMKRLDPLNPDVTAR